ncbi:MAG: threonine--tRNA ligase [Clostridia bacterium]|jgi:threonyl-tRNA synthetase|nr:threonine--tRNA ligase [Clostridia bacterium]MDD4571749.1 threonine--tRNA ligase [Clostridia bacterium]
MTLIINLPDGGKKEFSEAMSALEVTKNISNSLAKAAVAAKVNGKIVDLNTVLDGEVDFAVLTFDDEEGKVVFWHSSSHIMAQAVQHLFPGTKFGIGPAIKEGFYYDLDSEHVFTPEDMAKIEAEMLKIVKDKAEYQRKEMSRSEALKFFADKGQIYKVELINDLPEDAVISTYTQGDFIDLCAGPHIPNAGMVKAIKLLSLAGAYWRGSEKNKMLQRIYGITFPKQKMLDDYIFRMEEAKKRDHRRLGQELGLFTFMDEGPGFPFFLPKGMILRNELEKFWREVHEANDYVEVKTPMILNRQLWERSGHWDHYKDNMYFTKIDDEDYAIKPMNCPGGILVYKNDLHSYRDLPIRMGELGQVHRHELSGALHGLMRVRCFTQDDAHIFMLPSQIKEEIKGVTKLVDYIYKLFGFEYHVELSTKPEKAMGDDAIWELATNSLAEAMDEMGMSYKINPGDGAFYGPKLDFHLQDSIGRTWQCGTIQLDFQMPEKFDMAYIGEDNQKHRPVMIHRVAFGSMERFIGILTEHFAGAFPLWLAPVQVKIMNITGNQLDYVNELAKKYKKAGIRVEVDTRNEKIGYKIREAQTQKIPYMLVIGDKEMSDGLVAVRKRGEGDIGTQKANDFMELLKKQIAEKTFF